VAFLQEEKAKKEKRGKETGSFRPSDAGGALLLEGGTLRLSDFPLVPPIGCCCLKLRGERMQTEKRGEGGNNRLLCCSGSKKHKNYHTEKGEAVSLGDIAKKEKLPNPEEVKKQKDGIHATFESSKRGREPSGKKGHTELVTPPENSRGGERKGKSEKPFRGKKKQVKSFP